MYPSKWVSEVSTNGHLRQAHVDHLKPDQRIMFNCTPGSGVGSDQESSHTPLVIVDDSSDNEEQPDAVMNSMAEPVVRPRHTRLSCHNRKYFLT